LDKALRKELEELRARKKALLRRYGKDVLYDLVKVALMPHFEEEFSNYFGDPGAGGTLKGKKGSREISKTTLSQVMDNPEVLSVLESDLSDLLRRVHGQGLPGSIVRTRLEKGM